MNENKSVIVVDENLPIGLIANTSAIMGATLGKEFPNIIGSDVLDKDGKKHIGIVNIPIPILKASADKIIELRNTLFNNEYEDLMVVDFSNVAQSCHVYDEYVDSLKNASLDEISYFGIAILGSKKKINKLTGSMPLLR